MDPMLSGRSATWMALSRESVRAGTGWSEEPADAPQGVGLPNLVLRVLLPAMRLVPEVVPLFTRVPRVCVMCN